MLGSNSLEIDLVKASVGSSILDQIDYLSIMDYRRGVVLDEAGIVLPARMKIPLRAPPLLLKLKVSSRPWRSTTVEGDNQEIMFTLSGPSDCGPWETLTIVNDIRENSDAFDECSFLWAAFLSFHMERLLF
ncbi:hypothetical protein Ancab_021947 [Ancistrocladus abbreviatus]